jgi:hypothetical protein
LVRRVPELRKDELNTLAEIGALNCVGNSPRRYKSTDKQLVNEDLRLQMQNGDCQSPPGNPLSFSNQQSTFSNSAPLALRGRNRSTYDQQLRTVEPHLARDYTGAFHRRDALWQVERAVRWSGPLLENFSEPDTHSPLAVMNHEERLVADFHGTGLTVGPHPMAYRRCELDRMGIRRAGDLIHLGNGQRVRVAGCVIVRQRPGTAKGFVFLSLEDETGIANAIITPDLFQKNRLLLVTEKFVLVEGILQHQDHVISVKTERIFPLAVTEAETISHDFH